MPQAGQRVLVVEDDPKTSEILRVYLEKGGFQVAAAYDGPAGVSQAREMNPDLIVLDLMLPGLSGTEVCRTLRQESDVPIIMLTALGTLTDKLEGLDLGADDFVGKPFSPSELVARVRAVLRRASVQAQRKKPVLIKCGDVALDLEQCSVTSVTLGDQRVRLTPTEFKVLAVLMRDPGRVFSRSQLVEKAMGCDYEGMDRTMDVHILNLRRKIEWDANRPEHILTVYGMGYKFGG